jgi:hypothetical protein
MTYAGLLQRCRDIHFLIVASIDFELCDATAVMPGWACCQQSQSWRPHGESCRACSRLPLTPWFVSGPLAPETCLLLTALPV